jgi:3-carboxy-cis,cis-muconate cycloisomerase
MGLLDAVLARGGVRTIVSDAVFVQAMLDFEAALAAAHAGTGRITGDDARAIAAACHAARYNIAELAVRAADTGTPVVPLVETLRTLVGRETADAVHLGATSQDVVDSAAMVVAKRSLVVILADLRAAAAAAAGLAAEHRSTLMPGRTLLQRAAPVTFGLKAAGWLTALDEADDGLERVSSSRLAVQLGGATGTLAAMWPNGQSVVADVAASLGLSVPVLPWHTDRTRIAELAGVLGEAAGALAKPALDVVLLAQTEVGEVREGVPGRGGSSAIPGKANPVAAVATLACARRAPGLVAELLAAGVHEHERAAGAWHAEWLPMRDLLIAVGSAAAWLRDCLEHLVVDADRMSGNLRGESPADVAEESTVVAACESLVRLALAAHEQRRSGDPA